MSAEPKCPCPPGTVTSSDCLIYFDADCGGCSGIVSPKHEPSCGVERGPHWVPKQRSCNSPGCDSPAQSWTIRTPWGSISDWLCDAHIGDLVSAARRIG